MSQAQLLVRTATEPPPTAAQGVRTVLRGSGTGEPGTALGAGCTLLFLRLRSPSTTEWGVCNPSCFPRWKQDLACNEYYGFVFN